MIIIWNFNYFNPRDLYYRG